MAWGLFGLTLDFETKWDGNLGVISSAEFRGKKTISFHPLNFSAFSFSSILNLVFPPDFAFILLTSLFHLFTAFFFWPRLLLFPVQMESSLSPTWQRLSCFTPVGSVGCPRLSTSPPVLSMSPSSPSTNRAARWSLALGRTTAQRSTWSHLKPPWTWRCVPPLFYLPSYQLASLMPSLPLLPPLICGSHTLLSDVWVLQKVANNKLSGCLLS